MAAVPQIDGLALEDFLTMARESLKLRNCLTDERDWQHMNKKWLCDVLFTKDQVKVQRMINEAVKNRRERLEQS